MDVSTIEANANRAKGDKGSKGLPEDVMHRRAVKEYIETLDDAAFGGATPTAPKFLSPVDPASRWTRTFRSGRAYYSYSTNYLIDCENAVIVDVEGSTALRPAEVTVTRTMIDRVEKTYGIVPKRLSGDTAYGTAAMLNWLVEAKGIEPHIPVFECVACLLYKSKRKDGSFYRDDFIYNAKQDHYTCPSGKRLKRFRTKGRAAKAKPPKDNTYRYREKTSDCSVCALKPICCPKEPLRKVPRSIYEAARDRARAIALTDEYQVSRDERKKVEMLFAHLKSI